MSPKIGPVSYKTSDEDPFLGREIHQSRQFSEHTQELIDEEVARILLEADQKAEQLLRERRVDLEKIAQSLLEHEELSENDLTELIGPSIQSKTRPDRILIPRSVSRSPLKAPPNTAPALPSRRGPIRMINRRSARPTYCRSLMGKKKRSKQRTDFRKKHQERVRRGDFTRDFHSGDPERLADIEQGESVSGKGELTRKRTVSQASMKTRGMTPSSDQLDLAVA